MMSPGESCMPSTFIFYLYLHLSVQWLWFSISVRVGSIYEIFWNVVLSFLCRASVLKNYCLCHSSNTLKVCYNNCQLHHVDGLTQHGVRQLLEANGDSSSDVFTLIGDSGSTLGAVSNPYVNSVEINYINQFNLSIMSMLNNHSILVIC